jgi:hypothetical protein
VDESTAADMDGGWKQVIEDYLEDFFRFFFPTVHAEIDFDQPCEHLDKELAKIMLDAAVGDREADQLIQVHWRDGGDELVLVHVEVQAQDAADFAERMYVYNTRIWERYRRPVVSLALLIDGDPRFRPDRYVREKSVCRLELTFLAVKLLDYKTEAELLADPSPFAIASLVQLRKLQAGGDVYQRYAFKLALARQLYQRGYNRDDVLKLFRFMDYVLRLTEALSIRFDTDLAQLEENLHMPYVTSIERHALQRGREEGRQEGREEGIREGMVQGAADLLRQALEVRFGEVPAALLEKIRQCRDVDVLRTLLKQVLTAGSLDELQF